jgi:hypothetical protein
VARYRTTLVTDAEPADCFAYLADFANTVAWDPGVVEARREDRGPIGVGSRFHVVAAFLGRRVPIVYEIEQHDAPKRVVLVGRAEGFRSIDAIEVEPAGRGARVRYDAVLELDGWRRLADPLLQLAFRGVGARAAAGLRRALAALPATPERAARARVRRRPRRAAARPA